MLRIGSLEYPPFSPASAELAPLVAPTGCHLRLCSFLELLGSKTVCGVPSICDSPRCFSAFLPRGRRNTLPALPLMSSQDVPMSDARFHQIHNAADGPLWKDRSFASARQILAHNWKARWSIIRLENDLVKTLLDALAQHPEERALFVHNLAEMSSESESEELPPSEAPNKSRG